MQLNNSIRIVDLAILIEKEKTLIVSDFHMGFEETQNKQGMLLPRFQFKDTIARLEKILVKTKPRTVVINGDLKHEFGRITDQEWTDTLKLLDFISKNCKEIILIKGNHDKIIEPIARKKNLKITDQYLIGDIAILHGDEIKKLDKNVKTIIIGHEHPAITLKENNRTEKYKCFLKGKYCGKELIVMPSFNLVTEGTNILHEQLLSPYLDNIANFEVLIINDQTKEALNFGKVKQFKIVNAINARYNSGIY